MGVIHLNDPLTQSDQVCTNTYSPAGDLGGGREGGREGGEGGRGGRRKGGREEEGWEGGGERGREGEISPIKDISNKGCLNKGGHKCSLCLGCYH